MRFKSKKNIGILLLVLAIVMIVFLNYPKMIEKKKIKKINTLMLEFQSDYTKKSDIIKDLDIYIKDQNMEVSELAENIKEKVILLNSSKNTYERIKLEVEKKTEEGVLFDSDKKSYAERLKKFVSEESDYYDEAQQLISELSGEKEEYYIVTIEYYSKHYSSGSQELNIKLKNTSGKDIQYLALDILEVDTDGNVINSDWTNTSALILDGASISLDTYFDYQKSDSELEFRIKNVTYR